MAKKVVTDKLRYNYIDVIKGILILIVIVHHIIGLMNSYGYSIINLEKLYVPFFMPAFFVVTGFCSNFNKPKELFLKTELKRLLIPAVVFFIIIRFNIMVIDGEFTLYNSLKWIAKLLVYGGSWFLVALLVSKVIYFLLNFKFDSKKRVIFAGVGLLIASLAWWMGVYEVWYLWHALGLLVFLAIGQKLKEFEIQLKHFVVCSVVYGLYVFALVKFHLHMPRITSTFDMYPWEIFHFVIAAVAETIIVWFIGRLISKNRILEYFGRNSLVVFVTHWIILKAIICLSTKFGIQDNMSPYLFLTIAFVLICAICAGLVELINTKYLKWTIGKI